MSRNNITAKIGNNNHLMNYFFQKELFEFKLLISQINKYAKLGRIPVTEAKQEPFNIQNVIHLVPT